MIHDDPETDTSLPQHILQQFRHRQLELVDDEPPSDLLGRLEYVTADFFDRPIKIGAIGIRDCRLVRR